MDSRQMEATFMKILGVISTTALLLMLGATVPSYAQDEHPDKDAKPEKQDQAKPAQHEEQAKPMKQEDSAKPAQQEEKSKPAQHEEPAKPEEHAKTEKQAPEAKPAAQEEQKKPAEQEKQAKAERQPEEKPAQQQRQRTAAEQKRQRAAPALRLSARSDKRIPDDRFRSNFGREHSFRIGQPRMVGGYSRFQYGGYWFGFVQPWPDGWYYTDDVYVDYIDGGYYLCNPSYPGNQIAISVVL
jgi:outer membrane biosynthesis protein TonB